ncbi:AraC family transcriptional regulator [uncultured Amnibacterium sp.]|uniref:helix-turn-helix transcriptional regulator n=1 Tax=uncultured Amnibacterium sp. TaxID=1631851 RepID=UPI0035CAD777
MVDSLLRLRYSASDPVAATAATRAVFGSAEVTCGAGELSWEQVSLVDDAMTVTTIRSAGGRVRVRIREAAELLVVLVRGGSARLRYDEYTAVLQPDELGLVPIGVTAELQWDGVELDVFSITPAPLARLLGVPRAAVHLHAPRIEPRSPALADYFRRVADLLVSGVFATPEVYAMDLTRTHTIDMLTSIIVEAFELTNASEDPVDRDLVVTRRAVAEMRAHLAEPIAIPDIAQAAGVSLRGLQTIFERELGVSPMLHLRQLRMEAARSALMAEAEHGTTVAEIARRFGYSNSGRFSTHYRNEFGESPAATLQHIRSGRLDPSIGGETADGAAAESEVVQPQ